MWRTTQNNKHDRNSKSINVQHKFSRFTQPLAFIAVSLRYQMRRWAALLFWSTKRVFRWNFLISLRRRESFHNPNIIHFPFSGGTEIYYSVRRCKPRTALCVRIVLDSNLHGELKASREREGLQTNKPLDYICGFSALLNIRRVARQIKWKLIYGRFSLSMLQSPPLVLSSKRRAIKTKFLSSAASM